MHAQTLMSSLHSGMNSGVMLFRKSEWSLKFLQAIADLGRIPEPKLGEVSGPRKAAFLAGYKAIQLCLL